MSGEYTDAPVSAVTRAEVCVAASDSKARSRRMRVDLVRMEKGLAASARTRTTPWVKWNLASQRW